MKRTLRFGFAIVIVGPVSVVVFDVKYGKFKLRVDLL